MSGRSTRIATAGVVLLLSLAPGISACGSSGDSEAGDLKVFAAASLTEAFTELGQVYEREHDGAGVTFSFASSSDLAGQINAGAPADVFASADEPNMEKVVDTGSNLDRPVNFAGNVLEIAVPKGNPGKVELLDDLAKGNLKVALCAPEVPCGNAAKELLDLVGVKASVDSYEPDVKAVLTKVELGEVDAGLVYHSDVLAAGEKIDSIRIPQTDRVVNTYPIVVVKGGENPEGGQDFIDLVVSDQGQKELAKWGFRSP
ncbi:MAG: molybdate ABC transporter substrate-binding protein [Solirubrobacterales bacterium]|nr:molybdate ABC transporter substrate-binding protein [Solirubrobacterales bacterium]